MNRIEQFFKSEDGAVTVDWVVLTAAILGLGLLVLTIIAAGATDVSTGIGASLSGGQPASTTLPQFN